MQQRNHLILILVNLKFDHLLFLVILFRIKVGLVKIDNPSVTCLKIEQRIFFFLNFSVNFNSKRLRIIEHYLGFIPSLATVKIMFRVFVCIKGVIQKAQVHFKLSLHVTL
jgi:hypothetical protein